jgi:hypothetical protein
LASLLALALGPGRGPLAHLGNAHCGPLSARRTLIIFRHVTRHLHLLYPSSNRSDHPGPCPAAALLFPSLITDQLQPPTAHRHALLHPSTNPRPFFPSWSSPSSPSLPSTSYLLTFLSTFPSLSKARRLHGPFGGHSQHIILSLRSRIPREYQVRTIPLVSHPPFAWVRFATRLLPPAFASKEPALPCLVLPFRSSFPVFAATNLP